MPAERGGDEAQHPLADVGLPVEQPRDALPHLRRPFTAAAVKWKVQSTFSARGGGAVVVAYIDARLVIDRLNMVVGPNWSEVITPIDGSKMLRCDLRVFDQCHQDVGAQGGMDAWKSGYSDALKRAAVKFGIGVSVYALPQQIMFVGEGPERLRTRKKQRSEERVPVLDDDNRMWLAERYEEWLEHTGVPTFGPPLDHGDVGVAQGYDDEREDFGELPAAADAAPPIEGEQADELRAFIRARYELLLKGAPMALPPGVFESELARAERHSIEALEAVGRRVEGLLREHNLLPVDEVRV